MRYLAQSEDDISTMLEAVGKPSIDSLFDSIPEDCRLKRPLALPDGLSEMELKQTLGRLCSASTQSSFMGAGATPHFVPESVSQQLLRSEWYTAYTPYQPEMAQGTLQAIFEYQTMVANLYGCDVSNASLYDGATALVEAILMASRVKKGRSKILVSAGVHPEYLQTCQTYLKLTDLDIEIISLAKDGLEDLGTFESRLKQGDILATVYQVPSFLGTISDQAAFIKKTQDHGAIAIAVNTEPVAMGAIRSPGSIGADIVVGEGLGLCGHLSLGGPGVGLFACKQQYLRQMPGRLVGETVDDKGERGFVLTLSTREQHIRRERATSNVCTNHSLMALAFSMSVALYGKVGFKKLAERNLAHTAYFRKTAKEAGLILKFKGAHFNETVVVFENDSKIPGKKGVKLSRFSPEFEGQLLVCTTELNQKSDIDQLVSELSGGVS